MKFYFYGDEITSDAPLVYHPPPVDDIWLSESECQACCHELEECHDIAEDHKQVKWIDETHDDLSWQWPVLSSGKFEDTFEDIGHVWDKSFLCPRTFLQNFCGPKVI